VIKQKAAKHREKRVISWPHSTSIWTRECLVGRKERVICVVLFVHEAAGSFNIFKDFFLAVFIVKQIHRAQII
jgi:hypothetical protein